MASFQTIAEDLKFRMRNSTEQFLKKGVAITEIPEDDLLVLCKYFSISMVVAMFGGKDQPVRQRVNRLIKERENDSPPVRYVSEEPPGIGGWKFCERLNLRAIRAMEEVLHASAESAGGTGFVSAAKFMSTEAQKGKDYSAALMDAYQGQILSLAEHVTERFLPWLSSKLKRLLKEVKDEALMQIADQFNTARSEKTAWRESAKIWAETVDKIVRKFGKERIELMFAESLAENPATSSAFDFSKELVETFAAEEAFEPESEDVALIRASIRGRSSV